VHRFLFDALAHPPAAEGDGSANVRPAGSMPGALARSPEQVSAIWRELSELGGAIADADARAEYLAVWRARFEREVSAVPQVLAGEPLHSFALTAEGDYAFPESESDSAARLIALVRALLKRREERRAINDEIRDLMSMAEMAGFHKVAITSTVKDIEADLQHGPEAREEAEMNRVLYRRVLGVRGPLSAAMLPQLVEGRARVVPVAVRRRAAMHALIDAGGVAV
jgi:DNA primase